ncbi:SGNH/GDSL hydrolase family protein [Actinopolymorpha sp. B17G11]|uniref:SGNH/GDSL hydrolase family protein n=1 Tax=unclassified Actinopolymorpha TaxID=2627063 RepID=UPI0032D904A5
MSRLVAFASGVEESAMRGIRQQAGRIFVVLGFAVGSVLVGGSPAHAAPAYTALGDSYSSGVGTRSYYDDGTTCKRSPYAYPVLDAARLGAALTFAACSGAKVSDVRRNQLGSLNASTRYVTASVGGNDAGFAPVIIKCAQPWPTTCWGAIDNSQAFIRNTLPGLLDGLYSAIRNAAPNARVVVVGYPRLFNGEECNLAARISPGEQAELNATADLLATTIRARAASHGFAFADARSAYTGHSVCDDVEWINGLSNPIGESYHPNRAGQQGYANLVEPALRG